MAVPKEYQNDLAAIFAKRRQHRADFWATSDGRWGKGSPFSTFDCILLLTELGMGRKDPILRGAAEVILGSWKDDGRFRPAPSGAIYPCHTANAARVLGRLGFGKDRRLKRTYQHLIDTQHDDGGWRCNKKKLGFCPETDASNPGVTLSVLDAFRFSSQMSDDKRLDQAVKSLLGHWDTRIPLGPCYFGIGTLFMQVEYPFLRYNLFFWVYVLSHYGAARKDRRFKQALKMLGKKLVGDQIVVENPNRGLAKLVFCQKGEPSKAATKRYREILSNISG